MKLPTSLLRRGLAVAAVAAGLFASYRFGYDAGLADQGPDLRALMVVRRTPGNPNSMGASATWFDVRKPAEAAKLRSEQERLTAAGVEHYVAKGVYEKTLHAEPDPSHVDSHR